MSRATAALLAMAAFAHPAPDRKVLDLLAEDLDAQMRRHPLWASERGDRRFDALLEDLSPEAIAAYLEDCRDRLRRANAMPREGLSEAALTNLDLLRHELERRLQDARFFPEQLDVTQMSGPQIELPQVPDRLSFTTARHLEDYAARLEAVPRHLAQVERNLRAGLAEGRTPPRAALGQVPAQALYQGGEEFAKAPERHAMYAPFRDRPADDPLAARARAAIRDRVVPAFRAFGEFLRDAYVPGCRATTAASDLPDGRAFYDARLRAHTTTSLTADEIHAIGLEEVARIRREMFGAIARSAFPRRSELKDDALFAAFVEWLRTEPRFYHASAEALVDGYRAIAKRVDAELPRLFGRLPRLPYGVREMPRYMAPAAPTAYYYRGSLRNGVPGWFVANTHRLDQRPRYEMIPLTLHEAVPGHHLQIALADEIEGLPEWRSLLSYTAFVEGWALYAERLGLEMPELFDDPHDDFGRLSYEMWRALRLVVDTGLHAKGWTRERAVEYMLANSALTRENVEREVDRYVAWPGQAVAYKIGERKIRELRARAEAALGGRFDLRAFHDALLEEGALPLPVLERKIERFVAGRAR